MIGVRARDNETIDALLRRFNKAVGDDGILKTLRERSHFEKPSVKKRRIRKNNRINRMMDPKW